MASQFGITLKQLRDLMELRGAEGVDKVKEYGGVHDLCKKLKTTEKNGGRISRLSVLPRELITFAFLTFLSLPL